LEACRPVFRKYGNCRSTRGEKTMQGLKGAIVIATIIAATAALGACRKEVAHEPLKLGAGDVVVSQVAR
jgi:hypothetical protein